MGLLVITFQNVYNSAIELSTQNKLSPFSCCEHSAISVCIRVFLNEGRKRKVDRVELHLLAITAI